MSKFSTVLGHNDFCVIHHALLTELLKATREAIVSKLYFEKCLDKHEEEHRNVLDMRNEGKGKVRYVGGWPIIKGMSSWLCAGAKFVYIFCLYGL